MQHKKAEIFDSIENYIDSYVDGNGSSPTLREIADGVGLNNSTVCRYLAAMEQSGRIVFDEHRKPLTRQMQSDLANVTRTTSRAAIVGSIKCGSPDDVAQYAEDSVKLPKSIFGSGTLFILHASGDSMIEAGIEDGDLVVIRQQETANTGDIVVALTQDGTTLKGYFPEPEKRRIRLQPANREMSPMYYTDITIQGVAVKVIKDAGNMIEPG